MKKKIIIVGIGLTLLLTSVYAIADHHGNYIYSLGKLISNQEKGYSESKEGIYAEGKDIKITEEELADYIERYQISDSTITFEMAKEKAYQYLVERKVLLHAAKLTGCTVSEEELDDIIKAKKGDLEVPELKEEYESLYAGFGGEEQYWKKTEMSKEILL